MSFEKTLKDLIKEEISLQEKIQAVNFGGEPAEEQQTYYDVFGEFMASEDSKYLHFMGMPASIERLINAIQGESGREKSGLKPGAPGASLKGNQLLIFDSITKKILKNNPKSMKQLFPKQSKRVEKIADDDDLENFADFTDDDIADILSNYDDITSETDLEDIVDNLGSYLGKPNAATELEIVFSELEASESDKDAVADELLKKFIPDFFTVLLKQGESYFGNLVNKRNKSEAKDVIKLYKYSISKVSA